MACETGGLRDVGLPGVGVELDETAPGQPGCFQSDLCAAWEREAREVRGLGVRVVRARFGVVLGDGRQAHPWVHIEDAVGAIRFALETEAVCGAVNVVAPELVAQAGFAAALAGSLGGRVRVVVPGWALRGMGEVSQLLLDGQAATPRALLADGFRFQYPGLEGALTALAGRRAARLGVRRHVGGLGEAD